MIDTAWASRRFEYDALPGRVLFGTGYSRTHLKAELARLGANRVVVIVAEQEIGIARELTAPLGDLVVGSFTDVRPHVPVDVAGRARDLAKGVDADTLLSIGGGSTTGTAKAVALATGLPILAIPTTYAGSEVTPVWGLTEADRKTTGRDTVVLPKVVLYDPQLTLSLPPRITGPSAMNAIAHCVEAFYAPGANPVTSLHATEGIRALAHGARKAVAAPHDLGGRTATLFGAWLAGCAFAVAGSGLHHKICHALGGAYSLPHAETHAIVLPHVVAFNAPAIPDVASVLRRVLGVPNGGVGLQELAISLGIPKALTDIGLRADQLDEAVAVIAEKDYSDNPRHVDRDDLRSILEAAATGARPVGLQAV